MPNVNMRTAIEIMDFEKFRELLKKDGTVTLLRDGIKVEVSLLGEHLRCSVNGVVDNNLANKIATEDTTWAVLRDTNEVDELYYRNKEGYLALTRSGDLGVILGTYKRDKSAAYASEVKILAQECHEMVTTYLDEVDEPPGDWKNKFNKMVFDAGKRSVFDRLLYYSFGEIPTGMEYLRVIILGDGRLVEEDVIVVGCRAGMKNHRTFKRMRDNTIVEQSGIIGWTYINPENIR